MHRRFSCFTFSAFIFFAFMFTGQNSWAGKVVKVKSKKVYIILDAEEVENTYKGDTLYLTLSGKKKAIVEVKKMKGNKVIALLRKGKAKKGYGTMARKAKKRKSKQSDYESASEVAQSDDSSSSSSERPDLMFGVMGSFGSATQQVTGAVTADMTGSFMGGKFLVDYAIWGNFGVRGRIGMDMLSVSANDNGNEVQTDINYLSVDVLGRYYLMNDAFKLFANAGFGIYSPMSETLSGNPTALDATSISTTSLLIVGLGAGFNIGSMELFFGGDYLIFPDSETVKTTAFAGKLGLLFNF